MTTTSLYLIPGTDGTSAGTLSGSAPPEGTVVLLHQFPGPMPVEIIVQTLQGFYSLMNASKNREPAVAFKIDIIEP